MLYAEPSRTASNRLFVGAATSVAGAALAGAAVGLGYAVFEREGKLHTLFLLQDAPILLLIALFLLAVAWAARSGTLPSAPGRLDRAGGAGAAVLTAIVVAIAVYSLSGPIYRNFALSVDEFMAEFDAKIIASGKLLAAISPEWRDYVPALQPIFRLGVPEHAYWMSAYLPMNAALRAVFVLLGAPALHGAVLASVAIVATFGVARRLWPERRDAAVVAVLLLVSSSQFLVMAMTPYAMTAHLALNMLWLWLFLRDTRASHVLAAGVGFVACGLHQVVFHPLFAAPFLLSLLVARRWRLVAWYGAAYAAIGLFWILYWNLVLRLAEAPTAQAANVGMTFFVQRILEMAELTPSAFGLMGLNLLRFLAWQSPLAIPLAAVAVLACRRNRTITDLAMGMAMTLVVMLLLMPYQGHGWGYRYLHGFLGSLALLGAQGFVCLTERGADATRQATSAVLTSIAVALLVLFPWRAYQVRAFVTPYAAAAEGIARSRADVVLIDPADMWFGIDLVRNDPFLHTPPKVAFLGFVDKAHLTDLCRRYDVAIFDREDAQRFGIRTGQSLPEVIQPQQERRDHLRALGCGRRLLAGQ